MSILVRILAAVLLAAGCDQPAKAPAPALPPNTTAATQTARQTTAPPKQVVPKAPDYEDVRGVVREEGGVFTLLVEGHKPICLPFEAPAEARRDGVPVRFTLYLGTDVAPSGCRHVQTLISMRATD